MSIKTKLLIFGLGISLIPLFIITTISYFSAMSTIKQQTLHWLTAVAESKRLHILSLMEEMSGRVSDFSSDGFIRDSMEIIAYEGAQGYAVNTLTKHLEINKKPLDHHITAIAVLDINGMVVASTTEKWIGKDMSTENIFMSCVTKNYGETYIGKSYNIPYLNENCIFVSAPLTSREKHKTLGIIINAYNIAILDEITTKRAGMGESGEILLGMRRKDAIVFLTSLRYSPGVSLNKLVPLDPSESAPMRLALEGMSGAIIAHDYRGIDVVSAYQYIPKMNWGMVTKIDKKEVFASIVRLRIFTIIMGCISSIVIVTIVILISRRVIRPVLKLVEGTRKIANGDLSFEISTRSKDEIGFLATSFNNMTSQLRESKRQIEAYAQHLEQKVEDKTKEIRRSRDEWMNTFNAITDIITIHDKDFRIIRANKAFFEKFNDGIVQLPDKKCYEIFHGTSEPWPTCPLSKTAESLKPEHVEVDDPNMGGIFIVSTYPILDEKGKFCGVVHQTKDITERKKAEEEIRRGKEYTENLIETAQDAIVCIDENGIVNIWNQAAYKVFGYDENGIIGCSIKNIIPVNIFYRFLEMSKIIRISRVLEVSGRTKNGSVIPLEISISSQKIEEGRYTFTMIIRDITFQKEAKKQLAEKANMLATINKELEEFVYIVSHDLKEPLFVIEGYASRLYRAYKDIYDDKEKYYIDRIRSNVKGMSQKIQEIMEVLKVGRIAYNFREKDSGVIIREVINSLEGRIGAGNINVLIEHNLPAVFCDEKRMKDVFSNLVTNAIKFMGNGKQAETPRNPLTKEQSNGDYGVIRIGCHKNDDCYKFFVEDSGIGIREEHQGQIFKMFRRLKDIEAEGTGVGLAIVKKIVELHSGKIWVESPLNNGRGSRFCFTIPISKAGMELAMKNF